MKKTNEFSKALVEVEYILKHTDSNLTQNIPKSFLNFINENKDKEYQVSINENISLENQNIREDTKNLMSFIYRNYFCNLEEKKEYDELLNQNQYKYNEELKEKYSYDNLFKNNKVEKEEETEKQENISMQMVEYKEENVFTKIINKMKSLFLKLKINKTNKNQ